jgi:hypothetical protein
MKLSLVAAVVLAAITACKKTEDKSSDKPAATQHAASQPVATSPVAAPAPAVANAPRDPRIAELFKPGTKCTWNDIGLASCDEATKMAKLAFENQGSDTLAATCMGALRAGCECCSSNAVHGLRSIVRTIGPKTIDRWRSNCGSKRAANNILSAA